MSITILELARSRGAVEKDGTIAGSEFDRVGLPLFSGCQCCGASLAPYNAYPSRTGFIRCADCIDDKLGFETPEAFELWDKGEQTFTFHSDDQHGWLEVDWTELKRLSLNPTDFSTYSYRRHNTFFLEEDADAAKFVKAWEAKHGRTIKVTDAPHQERSFIRDLPRIHS